MKTYYKPWVGLGVGAFFLAALPFLAIWGDAKPSVAYLQGKPLNSWSIMALAAAGENPSLDSLKTVSGAKAIDFEASILALTAAGKDPRSFPSEDLIAKLKGFYDGTQLGEAGCPFGPFRFVIPAKAGIQCFFPPPLFRGED